ncbi:MAG TPA: Hsp20/alpha crystallin family protein [Anaerohalosphaeraceae bacterium]|jgi:HSP20 family protein|nr:Hsp20/alpha crystallin family protein [Anaerohalosphaeraceae bacterium]HRT50923.1 Hsp20/alpha crystallin family protein [Anaerohalosphaeraceae bacterium]HRT86616.1 Hsp20/alpha crystallin family protein [Anaerohalosphaeraceae bacterium]
MAEQELATTQKAEVTRRRGSEKRMFVPLADIWETEEEIVVKLDMPGVEKKNVDVKVEGDTLTVCGEVSEEPQGRTVYADRQIGGFCREFTLSRDLDRNKIEAEMEAGVLTIRVAKAEEVKPRHIQITTAK